MNNESFNLRLNDVRRLMADGLRETSLEPLADDCRGILCAGKMLRARMILRIGSVTGISSRALGLAAAAVEMIHAASLLHDDVIDGSELRRGALSFWVEKSVAGAILLGDLLVCRAFRMLNTGCPDLVGPLLRFVEEMCDAETEQELLLRNSSPDWEKCMNIARRKTGSLFAFSGYVAGGNDSSLRAALQEAGYAIGTAYQLADDVLDAAGNKGLADKTLGTDALNGKLNAVSAWTAPAAGLGQYIRELCATAGQSLGPWPAVQDAWKEYTAQDMGPVIDNLTNLLPVEAVK